MLREFFMELKSFSLYLLALAVPVGIVFGSICAYTVGLGWLSLLGFLLFPIVVAGEIAIIKRGD